MKRFALVLLVWLLAVPAFAGVVYVPLSADFEVGNTAYQTWVWATNHNTALPQVVEYMTLPSFTVGTERDGLEPSTLTLLPGETWVIAAEGIQGMMEISAEQDVYVQARLIPVGAGPANFQGINLPLITSDTVVAAGDEAHLLGWARGDDGATTYSNFGLINAGHSGAECLIDVMQRDGTVIAGAVPLPVNALSHYQFEHALSLLGVTDANHWRATVTCDKPFYSYVSLNYPETGRLAFIGPAPSGASELSRPNDGGVSDQFAYLSDLPIDSWGGLEIGPFLDATGIDWHPSGGGPPRGPVAPIRINGETYEKGVSFYPRWSRTAFIEYKLNGEYALFTATARLDDYYRGGYEWAIVTGDRWQELRRPSDGYGGRERDNPIRVSGAANFRVYGDGELLYQSPEVYDYGDPVMVEIPVVGVDTLRIQGDPAGTEQLNAPHRNGLSSPRLVTNCPWHDLFVFGDAKVFETR